MGTQCTHKTNKLDLLFFFDRVAPALGPARFCTDRTKKPKQKTNKKKHAEAACCLTVLLVSQVGRAICVALPKTPTLIPQHRPQDHELVVGDCHRADALRNLTEKEICAVTVASDEFVWKRRCCGISVGVFGKAAQMARPT